jgi:hypothetical protein
MDQQSINSDTNEETFFKCLNNKCITGDMSVLEEKACPSVTHSVVTPA